MTRPHLTRTAECALVARTRAGDRAAASALLHSLDGLLRRAAWPYRDAAPGLGLDDYLQEARLEVVASIEGYDPARGVLFRSYAMTRVRHRLYHVRRDALRGAERDAAVAEHATPTGEQSADDALAAHQQAMAIARALGAAVASVQGRERRIVRARLVTLHTGSEAASLREVGASLGCSYEHVRKVEAGALEGMRARLGPHA